MPIAFKLLQSQSISTAFATLYKVGTTKDPNAGSAIVSNVRLYNRGSNLTVSLMVLASDSATPVTFARSILISSNAQYIYNTSELALNKNASITVSCSAAPNLDVVICGVERV